MAAATTTTAVAFSSSPWYHRLRALLNLVLIQALLPVSLTYVLLQYLHRVGLVLSAFKQEDVSQQQTVTDNVSSLSKANLHKGEYVTSSSSSSLGTESETESESGSETFSSRSLDDSSESEPVTTSSDKDSDTKQNQPVESSVNANSAITSITVTNQNGHSQRSYTVVLTGGKMSKTLHIVRCLRSFADCTPGVIVKIVVLEQDKFRYCATRFSRCVDNFETITSPRLSPADYQQGIFDVCKKYNATHFLPVAAPVEAIYDAQVKDRLENELNVNVLHMDYELCTILDDKHKFGTFLQDTLQLEGSPRTCCVKSNKEAHEYNEMFQKAQDEGKLKRKMILKNLTYDPIHRLDLFQLPTSKDELDAYLTKIEKDGNPITEQEPWQLQEFLAGGVEYAAMIVVRNNHLAAMTCCPSSASQLNYVHIEIPAIRKWTEDFMTALRKSEHVLTGQLCFDFMVISEDDGTTTTAYPIECNPRVHTQCTSFSRDDVRALFGSILLEDTVDKETELVALLERDYDPADENMLNVYWFYNEFLKIFPNSWLLSYNDESDAKERRKMARGNVPTVSQYEWIALLCYMPSIILATVLASPAILSMFFVPVASSSSKEATIKLSFAEHVKAVVIKSLAFLKRLADMDKNLEGDLWHKDVFPYVAKNHIQVPSRLAATLRTGVEWKKIDFAIGKVVEVGGD